MMLIEMQNKKGNILFMESLTSDGGLWSTGGSSYSKLSEQNDFNFTFNLYSKPEQEKNKTGKPQTQVIAIPERVTFQGKTTVVFWSDNTKSFVRCGDLDDYDREAAVAFAIAHKLFGSKRKFKKFVAGGFEAMSVEEEVVRDAEKEAKKKARENQERDNTVSF